MIMLADGPNAQMPLKFKSLSIAWRHRFVWDFEPKVTGVGLVRIISDLLALK